jgi:hypothetical protein
MLSRPGLGTESLLGKLESIFEVRDHDHLDGMVFGKVITDSDADFTALQRSTATKAVLAALS